MVQYRFNLRSFVTVYPQACNHLASWEYGQDEVDEYQHVLQERSRELHMTFPPSIKLRRGSEWADPRPVISTQTPDLHDLGSPLPLDLPLLFHDGHFGPE